VAAGVAGATAVAAAALGAHALSERLGAAELGWWRTGASIHLAHALALLGLAAAPLPARWRRAALAAFVFGIAVFAGTLYAMALGAPRWLGAVTPLGGASLIAAWCIVALGAHAGRRA
jgi:uncharacterized membrane protein YgdD (TMEM256/DUF423 family)